MAYSMTGFGRAQGKFQSLDITIEIRSVNHRFQEISVRVPKMYANFENDVRDIVKKNVSRGKISVFVNVDQSDSALENLSLNTNLAKGYFSLLSQLKEATGIQEEIGFSQLMRFDDIFKSDEDAVGNEEMKAFFVDLAKKATDDLNRLRMAEGQELVNDMLERNTFLSQATDFFESESKGLVREEFDKLYKRLMDCLEKSEIDRERLEQELAIISDRIDISEEIVRLKSHVKLFDAEIRKGQPIGKRINFIVQEMNREVNTIGSKSSKISILHKVVDAKEEIEKIREQVQNIE